MNVDRLSKLLIIFSSLLGATAFAQVPPSKAVTQEFSYNNKHEIAGLTVHTGTLSLTVQSNAQDGRVKAGNMPALVKQRDADGRDVAITTETGALIAQIKLNPFAHPEKVMLGNDVNFMVVAQGDGRYKQTLLGPRGKVFSDRIVSSVPSRPPDAVFLEPVAADLGLSSNWRDEIEVQADDWLLTVRNKATGKTLLYVVRYGPDRVAFLPDGTAFYYDVRAELYVGRAAHTERYAELQFLVPDRFIYTRDGRVGAYVWAPATGGISSFWTEHDASGKTLIHFSAGASGASPAHGASALGASPGGAQSARDGEPSSESSREASSQRRSLRPGPNATYYCETTQTCYSTEYGESGCWPAQTTCYCVDCTQGGGGTCSQLPSVMSIGESVRPECASGGGSTSGGSGSNQVMGGPATLHQDVSNGLSNAQNKLSNNQQCVALLSNLTTTSPQPGGTPLVNVMNQRSFSNPSTYINNGIGFYYGQTTKDTQGNVPCSPGYYYAWTIPGRTSMNVCDHYTALEGQTGMEGNILIHEMLHTLGLPEGGQGQYTNQQITDLVTNACGN